MDKKNEITTAEAMEIANTSRPTIITWCETLKIGKKIAGRWVVYKDKLLKVMNGEITYPNKREREKGK